MICIMRSIIMLLKCIPFCDLVSHLYDQFLLMLHLCSDCMAQVAAMTEKFTVRCRYNAVHFLQNINERHPIARPPGRRMGCLLWVQSLIDILPQFLQWCVPYHVILYRVITALGCISQSSNRDVEGFCGCSEFKTAKASNCKSFTTISDFK